MMNFEYSRGFRGLFVAAVVSCSNEMRKLTETCCPFCFIKLLNGAQENRQPSYSGSGLFLTRFAQTSETPNTLAISSYAYGSVLRNINLEKKIYIYIGRLLLILALFTWVVPILKFTKKSNQTLRAFFLYIPFTYPSDPEVEEFLLV